MATVQYWHCHRKQQQLRHRQSRRTVLAPLGYSTREGRNCTGTVPGGWWRREQLQGRDVPVGGQGQAQGVRDAGLRRLQGGEHGSSGGGLAIVTARGKPCAAMGEVMFMQRARPTATRLNRTGEGTTQRVTQGRAGFVVWWCGCQCVTATLQPLKLPSADYTRPYSPTHPTLRSSTVTTPPSAWISPASRRSRCSLPYRYDTPSRATAGGLPYTGRAREGRYLL